jgi:hypothetical protein
MSLLNLTGRNVEEAIKKNLQAILVDMPKYKCMVGIPGGEINSKAARKYKKVTETENIPLMVSKHRRYKKFDEETQQAISEELSIRAGQEAVDIATYAAKNEFGSYAEHIPSRPFLRTTMEGEHLRKIEKLAASLLTECAFNNRGAFSFLCDIGLYAAGEVKKNINYGDWAPNSPVTIAIKGSDKPLVDTKTMSRSVTAWVTEKEVIA